MARPTGRRLDIAIDRDSAGNPDFTFGGQEASIVEESALVVGKIDVEGLIPTSIVADVGIRLRSTMARLVGLDSVLSEVTGVILGSDGGLLRQRITFRYAVLPSPGSEQQALAALHAALADTARPDSPIRQIMRWESQLYGPTRSVDTEGWTITAYPPALETQRVRRPVAVHRYSTSPLPPGTVPPPPSGTVPQWGGAPAPPPPPAADPCGVHGSPCLCALAPGCTWRDSPGACSTAAPGAGAVGCDACPVQPTCAGAVCGAALGACGCAASPVGCRWDGLRQRCLPRVDGPGSAVGCGDCARQAGCSPPRLAGLQPPSGALLGPAPGGGGAGGIRAAFDRNVSLCREGVLAQLHCDLRPLPIELGRSTLSVENQELTISLPPQSDPFTSECSLEIFERAVCDGDGVPFLGLLRGEYDFFLREDVAPRLLSLDPPNGTSGASMPLNVEIVFSERVRLSSAAAGLSAWLHPADGQARELPLASATVVGESLRLDARALAEADTDYSLVLPAGAVIDLSGNAFGGIPLGSYAFRTGHPPARPTHPPEESGLTGPAVVGIVGAAVVAVAMALSVPAWCYLRGVKPRGPSRLKRALSQSFVRMFSFRRSRSDMSHDMSNSASIGLGWLGDKVKALGSKAPTLKVNIETVSHTTGSTASTLHAEPPQRVSGSAAPRAHPAETAQRASGASAGAQPEPPRRASGSAAPKVYHVQTAPRASGRSPRIHAEAPQHAPGSGTVAIHHAGAAPRGGLSSPGRAPAAPRESGRRASGADHLGAGRRAAPGTAPSGAAPRAPSVVADPAPPPPKQGW